MPVKPAKVTEKLHIVMPLWTGDDGHEVIYAYVHSAPISRAVFEAHFMLLSKTFTALFGEGLGEIGGPKIASYMLKRIAGDMRDMEGYSALMNEIHRLSNVVIRTEKGWETYPYHDAIQFLNDDDVDEVENAVAFFIASSAMLRRNMVKPMVTGSAKIWGAEITSSDFTAFVASLKTLTPVAPTGVSQTQVASVPR